VVVAQTVRNSAYPRKPARKPGRIRTLSLCQSKGRAELGAGLATSTKYGRAAPDDCQEQPNRSSAELMRLALDNDSRIPI
jgi:hypothetical protein